MVVQIKSGKRGNGKSFSFNLYRKRSIEPGSPFVPVNRAQSSRIHLGCSPGWQPSGAMSARQTQPRFFAPASRESDYFPERLMQVPEAGRVLNM